MNIRPIVEPIFSKYLYSLVFYPDVSLHGMLCAERGGVYIYTPLTRSAGDAVVAGSECRSPRPALNNISQAKSRGIGRSR